MKKAEIDIFVGWASKRISASRLAYSYSKPHPYLGVDDLQQLARIAAWEIALKPGVRNPKALWGAHTKNKFMNEQRRASDGLVRSGTPPEVVENPVPSLNAVMDLKRLLAAMPEKTQQVLSALTSEKNGKVWKRLWENRSSLNLNSSHIESKVVAKLTKLPEREVTQQIKLLRSLMESLVGVEHMTKPRTQIDNLLADPVFHEKDLKTLPSREEIKAAFKKDKNPHNPKLTRNGTGRVGQTPGVKMQFKAGVMATMVALLKRAGKEGIGREQLIIDTHRLFPGRRREKLAGTASQVLRGYVYGTRERMSIRERPDGRFVLDPKTIPKNLGKRPPAIPLS